MSYKDRTFCASPDCKNECERQMSQEDKARLHALVWKDPSNYPFISYAYFCGEPKKEFNNEQI